MKVKIPLYIYFFSLDFFGINLFSILSIYANVEPQSLGVFLQLLSVQHCYIHQKVNKEKCVPFLLKMLKSQHVYNNYILKPCLKLVKITEYAAQCVYTCPTPHILVKMCLLCEVRQKKRLCWRNDLHCCCVSQSRLSSSSGLHRDEDSTCLRSEGVLMSLLQPKQTFEVKFSTPNPAAAVTVKRVF